MSTYIHRIDGLGRCHLAFAVANCVLNQRLAVAAAGCCDGLPVRPAIWQKMLSLRTTTTNRDLHEKAVYFPAWCFTMFYKCSMMFYNVLWCLVSRVMSMIGIVASATAQLPITTRISTHTIEIADNMAGNQGHNGKLESGSPWEV